MTDLSVTQHLLLPLVSAGAVLGSGIAPLLAADPPAIVEALRTNAGNPSHARASFAKGVCVRGTYTPSAAVASVTRSVSFNTPSTFIGRFSVGGGSPKVTDTTKTVLRGFSIKMQSAGGGTDLLFENAPVHFAKSLDQMLAFLQARAPSADGKPDTQKIAAFSAANPETLFQSQYVAAKPLPGSFAGIVYWGVHTFFATNKDGKTGPIKFKVVPEAGEIVLSDEDAKTKSGDFLSTDFSDWLARGPVRFDIVAIVGQTGEQTMDITARWSNEETRPGVTLGTLSVTTLEPNTLCDGGIFDPSNLAAGISAPKDELFAARQAAYAISFGHRSK